MPSKNLKERSHAQALVDAWESKNPNRKFPAAVWERWSKDEKPGVTRDSLRTVLRRWREAGATLEEHPGLRKVIVSLLSEVRPVTEAELFGPRRGERAAGNFPFHAFPALGEFDPAADEPFRAAMLHLVRAPRRYAFDDGTARSIDLLDLPSLGGRVWAALPPGAGRSFAANWAQHRSRPTASVYALALPPPRVLSLAKPSVEALDAIDEGASLVVDLEAAGEQMGAFIERLAKRPGSCAVLAPFDLDLPEGEFRRYEWRANGAWRDGFVRWVGRRLESLGNRVTRLDVAKFLAWAADIDPNVTRFATPGDLLPLLAYTYVHGTETLTKQFGSELVHSVLGAAIKRVSGITIRDRWLRESGVTAFQCMVRTWWRTPSQRWGTDLTAAAWTEMLPPDTAPTSTEAGERWRAIAKEFTRERLPKETQKSLRKDIEELLSDDVPAREAVRALVEARVLRDIGVDALGVSPGWMVEAMVETTVEQSLATDAPEVWGRWCVDRARRPFVEKQLFKCDDKLLTTLIKRAVGTYKVASFGAVAAVEALFVVVADRLASTTSFAVKRELLLKQLAGLQMDLLAPHYPNGLPAPRTRGGPHEPEKGGAEFVAASWAWSLHVEAPRAPPPGAAWLFPGWLAPSLDQIPDALMFHDRESADGPCPDAELRGRDNMRRLLPAVLDRVRGVFTTPALARRIPRNIAEAAIPLALGRGWSLALLVPQFRSPSLAESERLAQRVQALDGEARAQTIDGLWEVMLGEPMGLLDALRYFEPDEDFRKGFPRSALTIILYERFPVEKIEAAVAMATHWNEHMWERLLRMTPAEHRPRVARAIAKTLRSKMHTLIGILKAFGGELADVLVEEATLPERRENWLIAQAVWEVAPEIARELATNEYALGKIDPWITSIPEAHVGDLVAVVEKNPTQPVPDSLRFWLSRRLVEVGPEAERVWLLLQRAGWPTCSEPSRPT